jgi:hypothetical protein
MGVERAVTRWYLLRQQILNEQAAFEARLEQLMLLAEAEPESVNQDDLAALQESMEKAHMRLRELGPSPQPKMG